MNSKIIITLNEQKYRLTDSINLIDLLTYLNYNSALIVLEYNKKILPKYNWNRTFLKLDDNIEIITIVGGG
jgi:sulfur carrier protein|tara:strand:+ start:870 stop:1082 length:213 start_codon:yes stop_codon:yes gene_type:complete